MKRKPVQLKKIEGTYRKDRDKQVKYYDIGYIPEPPKDLNMDEFAKKIWSFHIKELVNMRIISELDLMQYAVYCIEMARYFKCNDVIQEHGEVFVTSTGYPQQRPEVSIMRNSFKLAYDIANKFGLTPIARENLTLNSEDSEESDPLSKLLNSKNKKK